MRFRVRAVTAHLLRSAMRPALLVAAGRSATDAQFDALLAELHSTNSQEERRNLLEALVAGKDPLRAQRLLDESLSGRLPGDISSRIPGALARQPLLGPLAYDFVVAHWEAFKRLAGDGPFGGHHWLLPDAAGSSSDAAVVRTLVADQKRLAGPSGETAAARVAAMIDNRSRLRAREAPALGGYAVKALAP